MNLDPTVITERYYSDSITSGGCNQDINIWSQWPIWHCSPDSNLSLTVWLSSSWVTLGYCDWDHPSHSVTRKQPPCSKEFLSNYKLKHYPTKGKRSRKSMGWAQKHLVSPCNHLCLYFPYINEFDCQLNLKSVKLIPGLFQKICKMNFWIIQWPNMFLKSLPTKVLVFHGKIIYYLCLKKCGKFFFFFAVPIHLLLIFFPVMCMIKTSFCARLPIENNKSGVLNRCELWPQ